MTFLTHHITQWSNMLYQIKHRKYGRIRNINKNHSQKEIDYYVNG